MVGVRVVRVFASEAGRHGNPLGVVLAAPDLDDSQRQEIARAVDFSETVFVDDPEDHSIRIFTRKREIPFAGHPAVGASWLLAQVLGQPLTIIKVRDLQVQTWHQGGNVWVRSALATTPPWWHERLDSADDVSQLREPLSPEQDAAQLWAWEDEKAGIIRARTFAARFGTPEDEATGSASMRLAAALGRRLVIHHGEGSVVLAHPGPPGYADLGGRVVEDDPREV